MPKWHYNKNELKVNITFLSPYSAILSPQGTGIADMVLWGPPFWLRACRRHLRCALLLVSRCPERIIRRCWPKGKGGVRQKKKDMKFQKKKDIKRRKSYSKYEMKRIFSKYLLSQTISEVNDASLGSQSLEETKNYANNPLGENITVLSALWRERLKKSHKIPRQSSKVRLRGRCLRTNRPRSISQLFRISRQECRRLALDGQIPGVTRSSW